MASTNIIGDLTTVSTTAWSTTSAADALSYSGPIQDLTGNAKLCLLKAQEMKALLTLIKAGSDSGDSNYTLCNNVLTTLGS